METYAGKSIASRIYKNIAKILGIVLVLVGIGAVIGGKFADSFIEEQLADQAITLPTEEAIDSQLESGRLQQEDADVLRPMAGEAVVNGVQAKAFANNYIYAHMKASTAGLGLPEGTTYSNVSQYTAEPTEALTAKVAADNPGESEERIAALVEAEIANPATEYEEAKEIGRAHV